MITKSTARSYNVDPSGVIFTSDVITVLDDDGSIISVGTPHRISYPPGTMSPKNPDAALVAMGTIFHTPEAIASYETAQKVAIDGTIEAKVE